MAGVSTGSNAAENAKMRTTVKEEKIQLIAVEESSSPAPMTQDLSAEYVVEKPAEIQKILMLLEIMHSNYVELKSQYEHGSKFFHNFDLCLFSIPLLVLQTLLGMLHHVVPNANHAKLATSILSIVSALLIGVQLKLAWVGTSKKYEGCARAYHQLEVESKTLHLELSTAAIDRSLTVESALQSFTRFVDSSKKIEMAVGIEKPETACFRRRKSKKDKSGKGGQQIYTALAREHDRLLFDTTL